MKRFLSWLALIGIAFLVDVVISLDFLFLKYLLSLYAQLTPFFKLVIILIGGTFFLGLLITPIYYGLILSWTASESICQSKKGLRYTVIGASVAALSALAAIGYFTIPDIIYGIYGILLIFFGHHATKDYNSWGF